MPAMTIKTILELHLGMNRRKMATGTVAEDVFTLFSARSDGASPRFPATVFTVKDLPDRQLACAPVDSPEGREYLGAMRSAANYAWANRQLLMWQTREIFAEFFGQSWESMQMNLVYDVAHNIAKIEEHTVEGIKKKLCVHRKGATRAFPAGHPEVPEKYRQIGQPVIIPGDMGRASWVLVGMPGSMEKSFGSSCHGAGRVMSRTAAIRHAQGRRIDRELAEKGRPAPADRRGQRVSTALSVFC